MGKLAYSHHLFPNIITYIDRTIKGKQNDINFKMK